MIEREHVHRPINALQYRATVAYISCDEPVVAQQYGGQTCAGAVSSPLRQGCPVLLRLKQPYANNQVNINVGSCR